jgi:flagellar hook-associated protein FlgK
MLPVQFGTSGKLYSLDEQAGKNLEVNVDELNSCIADFKEWAKEVVKNVGQN